MSPHILSLPRHTVTERLLALLVIVSLLLQPVAVVIDSLPRALPRVDITRDAISLTNVELAPSPATAPSTTSSSVLRLPSSLQGKDEIPALRTAHSATFDLGNGEFAVLEDATPLHYQDGDGLWQPINPAFEVNALGWINNTNSLRSALGRAHSNARLGNNGVGVAWTPTALILASAQGERTIATPRAVGGTALRSGDRRSVRYVDGWSLGGVADQWQSGPGQVEYTMRLAELPAVPFWRPMPDALDLAVDLTLQDGVVLTLGGEAVTLPLETQEALVFRGVDGAQMILQPPLTYEQDRPEQRVAGSYVLSRGDAPGVIEVRVRTPWSWLAAAERNFPVIIDPMFQMRSASSMLTWSIDPNSGAGQASFAAPHKLGRTTDAAHRLLLRFNIPRLPNGSTITKATLLVKPGDYVNLNSIDLPALLAAVKAYPITAGTGPWRSNNDPSKATPQFDEAAAFAPGVQMMGYQPRSSQSGVQWDVTSAVNGWRTPNVDGGLAVNHGVILKADVEACTPRGYFLPFLTCGAFLFDAALNNWPQSELEFTQQGSRDPLDVEKTETGGVRLIVQYTAAALSEGQPVTMNYLGGANVPPGLDPYYKVTHAYVLPAAPNYWQAIAVRGFGPGEGQNPPPQEGAVFRRPLQGALPLSVRTPGSNNDEAFVEWQNVPGTLNRVSWALVNGRGTSNITPASIQAVVGANSDEPQPVGYEIRLEKEEGSLVTNNVTFTASGKATQTIEYTFNTYDPLALWNLNLPANSNTEVRVTINGDTTVNGGFQSLADLFTADIVNSTGKLDLRDEASSFTKLEKKSIDPLVIGIDNRPREFSQLFTPPSGQNALVLAYHGPAVTINDVIIPTAADTGADTASPATGSGDVGPVGLKVTVQVTSCAAGSYPDAAGNCIKVECPSTSFPAANIVTAGGMRLWSANGWNKNGTTGTSIYGESAAMLGPLNGPPTVMLIGSLSYNTAPEPDTVSVLNESKAILVNCPTPGPNTTSPTQEFVVSRGALTRQTVDGKAGLRFSNLYGNVDYNVPWTDDDRSDIARTLTIFPTEGKATGSGLLNRYTGTGQSTPINLRFDTAWSWTAQGWPSLTVETLTPRNDNPSPAPIASIDLSLGSQFNLDVQPINGNARRTFLALRAPVATLTQPASMGGASRHVQAVILPRNAYVPTTPAISCWRSCIDLRGPNDSVTRLDRVWEMPDVHVGVDANTVLMRSAGVLQVYSTDHPSAAGGFAQEYSFDAYKASVSVEEDYCTDEDIDLGNPKVLVIRGETRMALPNIGSTNDPNAAISAGFKLCETSLRNVHMSFKSPVGLPLGSSGLFLTGLDGEVDITPVNTRITLGLDFQAAPGGDGGVFKVRGEVIIDTLGLFEFQGTGSILGTVDVDGRIWVAWNPLDTGFEINIRVGNWLRGFARAHLWVGQGFGNKYTWLPDNDEKHFAGEIGATLTIPEGIILDWGVVVLPPTDIDISVEVAFGQFCTNNSCTSYEWGIKGKFTVLGYDVGVYYGFDKGLDFILGNDDHILIDEYGGGMVAVASGEMVHVQAGPARADGAVDIPFTIQSSTEQILVGVGWQAGSPQLTLIDPDGAPINPVSAGTVQAHAGSSNVIMTVQSPKPGNWIARLSNLSDAGIEHYKFVYLANGGAPGTPTNRGRLVSPANAEEDGTNSYNITWEAPADSGDNARISLFYSRTEPNTGVLTGALGIDVPIVQNLPFKNGSFTWNTQGLRSGSYQIKAVVDDGVNDLPVAQITQPDDVCVPAVSGLPLARAFAAERFPGTVVMTATGTVRINDVTPPATPTGLQVEDALGALVAQWTPLPANGDATHYLLRWGPRNAGNPAIFDVENQTMVSLGSAPVLRLGAVKVDTEYGVDISAVDASGNVSAASAPVFATVSGQGEPVPFAPLNFALTGVTATTASFQWALAFGPTPAGYRLTYTKLDGSAQVQTLDVANAPATIPNLSTGATYDVALTAFNSEGWQSAVVSPTIRIVLTDGVDGNGDGVPDDWAQANNVANAGHDSDGDGVSNGDELGQGTHPQSQDSDGDGLSDGEERAAGSDPLDGSDFGPVPTQPRLLVLDDRLSFTAKQAGGAASAQTVEWANVGAGNLTLQASSADGWISASVVTNTVQISVDHTGLAAGFHSGVVRLSAAPGSDPLIGDAACIRVNAWVLRADDDVPAPLEKTYLPVVRK